MSAEIKIFPEQQRPAPANVNERARVMNVPVTTEVMDIKHVMNVINRQRHVIIGTAVLVTMLTVLAIFQIKPTYESSAQIMIEPRQARVVDVEQVVQGLPADQETIRSEEEIIRSHKLAEGVINKLNLWQSPEFNEALQPASPTRAIKSFFGGLNTTVNSDATAQADLAKQRVIDRFLENLDVSAIRNSRVITISFRSGNPDTARTVTAAVVAGYLTAQLQDKFEATQRASVWLNDRLDELRKKVAASEQAVEAFRAQAGLTQGRNNNTISTEQLSELNVQLITARTQRAELESKLRQVQGLSEANLDTASDVLQSPVIQKLREQESGLIQKQAEMSNHLGPRHPDMIKMQAELTDVKKNIQVEIGRIVNGLRNDVAVARSREGALAGGLQGLENHQGQLGGAEVKLHALEREADANRTLFETFLNRFKQTSSQEDLQAADARMISSASLPAEPVFPKPKIMIPTGMLVGVVLGVMIALLLETLDRGFRSMEQVENSTGLSPLGLVPELPKGTQQVRPADYVVQHPTSAYAEAIRTVRTAVLLTHKSGAGAKTVLVTSSMPAEGKTSFVLSFARVSAMSGQKILVIDCDTRRPTVHTGLGLHNKLGIIDVLLGTHKLAEVVQKDRRSTVQVISAGRSVPNPADLLASDKMKALLTHLRTQYDLIIIDSPPTLAVSDARVLSELVDKTVFISRWAETARDVAQMATRQLVNNGANMAGVLLTRVNVQKNARYGYADSGYYGRKYTKYYGTAN